MKIIAAILALSLPALANEVEKRGKEFEAGMDKVVKQGGEVAKKQGKQFDKGVRDSAKAWKKALSK